MGSQSGPGEHRSDAAGASGAAGAAGPRRGLVGTRTGLVIGLSLIAIVSQFFRSSVSVIAPELIRELSLTPEALGLVGGMFFLALGAAQIPVGMSFDRIGPRRTVAAITVFAFAGSLLVASADTAGQLIAGRFLVGFGCGASFTSSVVLLTRWYPPERVGTMYGRVFAISQVGNFMAATPLAWLSERIGWRTVFFGAAFVAVAVVTFFWRVARDHPPGAQPPPRRQEPLATMLRGFGQVLRQPGYLKVVAVHSVAYATLATVLGLWAGPYLHDVHGLDGVARGHVLLAMSGAQMIGMLYVPPLEQRFNTRKRVIIGAALGVIAVLLVLAAIPAPPTWLAIGLLVALAGLSTYSPVIIAHAAALTPRELLGRGSVTANLGQVAGSFLLPVASGAIAGLFVAADHGYPPQAYRTIFAGLALALGTGVLVYSRARDLGPHDQRA